MPNSRLDKKLNLCLDSLIKKQIKIKSKLDIVDGLGGKRVSEEILKLFKDVKSLLFLSRKNQR